MDTRIYVCTHKQYTKPESPLYHSLHVGRAISEDLGYEGDNTGDHISERNKSFCELTGLYWIWKNVQCDIVGICHYRRYFIKDEDFLKQEEIEHLLTNGYDAILPTSSFTHYKNTREHYAHEHYIKDLDVLRKILSDLSPESLPAFDLSLSCNLLSAWNMLITRKEIFDEYCSWLFPILFEAEKRIDISSYDTFQGRLFGYLSERLIRVFFMNHTYRVYEAEVRLMNPEDAYNQAKRKDTVEKLLRLKIHDLLTIYLSGNHVNLVEPPKKQVDLHGKLPVWVCWWQGFQDAPDLVRICRDSWRKHLPDDLAEIHEITFDNYTNYVTFPDWILKRYRNGHISMTMLSDLLRMALLYRYGGLWMDATYYLAQDFPQEYLTDPQSFYSIRSETAHWKTDITEGKWSGNFLKTAPGALLPQFVLNAFYYYFIENEDPADYFMIDYFIRIAYESFPEIQKEIDNCPFSQPEVMALQGLLAEPYDELKYEGLLKETAVFKLNYRMNPPEKTLLAEDTFWGHLRMI